ncbi:hypothetical protein BCIN_04g00190 [Botrytis cinerea B05.10]|uniref:Uncharacterized protein n=1 Tax=Botryotinia fuckeliana (strain B05.10) TaxID=332648 RepID=A0A384JEE6_BOTFB|nr:hypothetical protein BCIN_04g00190 [Botrytis cinerea B05.10]ATZ48787.1 hypothetical protein BCIN_04g00190 [Botrytis cinerea B05.10]
METYGKKKKNALMGSFASLRNNQQIKAKKNRASKRESSTRQLSAFHSSVDNEEQQPVREAPSEDNSGLVDEIAINEPRDKSTAIENTLPQLPSLNFSENEMCITDKSTAIDTGYSNGTAKSSLHARKSSAPPIPRKSSKRQSALNKTSRRRSPTKESQSRRFPKGPIIRTSSGLDEQSNLIVSPSDPNAVNPSVAQTFKAMEELKPGSTNTLVVEKKRRLKAGAFLKVKNVLQGSFRRRKNDNSQENHLVQPPFVNSPIIQEQPSRRPESLSGTDLRLNEVQNFKENSKLQKMTGNLKIPRKPLNSDVRSFHSQNSALTDPFTEPPSSSEQVMQPSTFSSQMPEIGSAPEFSSLHRTNNKSSAHQSNRDFDDLDSLLTSSPLAQSTPRLRLVCNHTDPDRTRRMHKVDAGSPSVLDHNTFAEDSEIYQGMLGGSPVRTKEQTQPEHLRNLVQHVGLLREKTVNNFVAAVQTLSGSTSDSGFAPLNRKWKKNPSPSKARLEELSRRLPYFPDPEPILYRTHKHKDSKDINKATFASREKRKTDDQENKELLEGLLTSDDEERSECEGEEEEFSQNPQAMTRASTSLPLINLSSRPISLSQSSLTLGVEGLEVRVSARHRNLMDQDDSMMDLDELQSVQDSPPSQTFYDNVGNGDLIEF